MVVKLLFFAALRERMGRAELAQALPDDVHTIDELRAFIEGNQPSLTAQLGSVRFAVNEEFVSGEHLLREGDEIALIPPVSGG